MEHIETQEKILVRIDSEILPIWVLMRGKDNEKEPGDSGGGNVGTSVVKMER